MNKLETPLLEAISALVEYSEVGDKVLEKEFSAEAVQAELVTEAKYYISEDPEFEQEMHPNIEGTEEEFIAKAHAIIDAAADEATEEASNKKGLFYQLSPKAFLNYEGYRQRWNEVIEHELYEGRLA